MGKPLLKTTTASARPLAHHLDFVTMNPEQRPGNSTVAKATAHNLQQVSITTDVG
ncbi:hypothetical protein C1H46_029889 [Malus baccata]|uniref:Uncharacterized protein n=1 Tax=Malus baccata TaxID=106549 RepID=A0A540LDI1_MALBA|nr:hypothetical protein C1H46_029889 [Malus baccata]